MISHTDGWDGPAGGLGGPAAKAVRTSLERQVVEMTAVLGELVIAESSTDDPEGLARVAELLESMLAPYGTIERRPSATDGVDHLLLNVPGEHALPPAVVLGHFDTVWARGTLEHIPFRVSDAGVVTGPGCFDMKGGLVLLVFALREMAALGVRPRRPVRIVLNADEEVGSPSSRGLIAEAADGAAVALVLEGPLPGGTLKTARKGSASYTVTITGRAAHSGIEPGDGVSAVLELAHQVLAMDALSHPDRGTTVNVGVVRGGSRVNVVPGHAEARIHVRTVSAGEADRVRDALRDLQPHLPGAQIDVVAGLAREPMERTPQIGQLYATAAAIAAEMGVCDLREGSTGGASDGNLVAALGIPTLDGLGPEGGGAHADHEHVVVASLPRRAALIAGLLCEA